MARESGALLMDNGFPFNEEEEEGGFPCHVVWPSLPPAALSRRHMSPYIAERLRGVPVEVVPTVVAPCFVSIPVW